MKTRRFEVTHEIKVTAIETDVPSYRASTDVVLKSERTLQLPASIDGNSLWSLVDGVGGVLLADVDQSEGQITDWFNLRTAQEAPEVVSSDTEE